MLIGGKIQKNYDMLKLLRAKTVTKRKTASANTVPLHDLKCNYDKFQFIQNLFHKLMLNQDKVQKNFNVVSSSNDSYY